MTNACGKIKTIRNDMRTDHSKRDTGKRIEQPGWIFLSKIFTKDKLPRLPCHKTNLLVRENF